MEKLPILVELFLRNGHNTEEEFNRYGIPASPVGATAAARDTMIYYRERSLIMTHDSSMERYTEYLSQRQRRQTQTRIQQTTNGGIPEEFSFTLIDIEELKTRLKEEGESEEVIADNVAGAKAWNRSVKAKITRKRNREQMEQMQPSESHSNGNKRKANSSMGLAYLIRTRANVVNSQTPNEELQDIREGMDGYVEDCDYVEDADLEEADILLDAINSVAAELDDNEYENMF
jgi:hypothetical protein